MNTSGVRRGENRSYENRSNAFAAIHEMLEGLHEVGAIDEQTMRNFDETRLTPVPVLAPEEIKQIRQREHISQPVFARQLNVSKNLVSDWERGVKKPGGPALRLLTYVHVILRDGRECKAELDSRKAVGPIAAREIREALYWIESNRA